MDNPDDPIEPAPRLRGWLLGAARPSALIGAGAAAYTLLKPDFGPTPAEIAGDPMLSEGWNLYQQRCSGCHGETGRGDGPLAATLGEPPPGDLTDGSWKYGDRPEDVVRLLEQGVPGAMPGWRGIMTEGQLQSVAAFVFALDDREIPDELRAGWSGPTVEPDLFAEDEAE